MPFREKDETIQSRRWEGKSIYVLVLFVWVYVSFPFLKSEWFSLEETSRQQGVSLLEKKLSVDGAIYALALAAQEVVPPKASLSFISGGTPDAQKHDLLKLHYYLWPRRIHSKDLQTLEKDFYQEDSDYVLVAFPKDDLRLWERTAGKKPFLTKLFEYSREGYYAVYRNDPKGETA